MNIRPTMTAILVLTALLIASPLAASDGPGVPNWRARCVDGSPIDFHETLAAGPVVISFWATWCKPCLRELPHLEELQEKYEGRVSVLAVNIDETRSVNKVRPFLKSKGIGLRVPMDTSGDIRRLLQVGSAVPCILVYDQYGNEVYSHTGYKDGDEQELETQVRTLLGEES